MRCWWRDKIQYNLLLSPLLSPIKAKRWFLAFRRRWHKNRSKRSINSARMPTTIPMTAPTGTVLVWAELELAWEVALGKSVTTEVSTEPSCLVVVTICVKTLGEGDSEGTVAAWHSQRRFEQFFPFTHLFVMLWLAENLKKRCSRYWHLRDWARSSWGDLKMCSNSMSGEEGKQELT